jgi:hypothetical protein
MIPKMDTKVYLDELLSLGRFFGLKDGLYVLRLFDGRLLDIVMYITILDDGTLKTVTREVSLRTDSEPLIHTENMPVERVCNIIRNQSYIATALTRVCNDFLEKTVGELSEIEESKVVGDINLDYCRVVSLGQFEVEVLYNRGRYECTVYPMREKPQKFYTMDIDKVETLLSEMKKKYNTTVKRVIEEELSKVK